MAHYGASLNRDEAAELLNQKLDEGIAVTGRTNRKYWAANELLSVSMIPAFYRLFLDGNNSMANNLILTTLHKTLELHKDLTEFPNWALFTRLIRLDLVSE
jgi:hypothetical protein